MTTSQANTVRMTTLPSDEATGKPARPAQPARSSESPRERLSALRDRARRQADRRREPERRPPRGGTTGGSRPRVDPEASLRVERWLDRSTLPARIPSPARSRDSTVRPATVILAGDLTLGDATYSAARRDVPRNLILVVDRLRLTGTTVFELGGYAIGSPGRRGNDALDRAGGHLALFVRELVVGDGARLVLRSPGGRGPEKVSIRDRRSDGTRSGGTQSGGTRSGSTRTTSTSPRYGGGHGGDLRVAVRRVRAGSDDSLESAFVLDAPAGGAGPGLPSGDAGRRRIGSSWDDAVAELETRDLRRYGFAFGMPSVSRWARRATSEWLVARLDRAVSDLRVAALGGVSGGRPGGEQRPRRSAGWHARSASCATARRCATRSGRCSTSCSATSTSSPAASRTRSPSTR